MLHGTGAEGGSGISKKKRVVKLSRKQLKRKEKKRSKGEVRRLPLPSPVPLAAGLAGSRMNPRRAPAPCAR
jgi:hypothetical protein